MAITISPEVNGVLERSTINGPLLCLPGEQLPRPLYEATNKVLTALGGKWNKKAGGHVFPFDVAPKIAEALGNGNVVSRQQRLQLFETPVMLAERLVMSLGDITGAACLEPSAGRGRIIQSLAARDPANIIAVEIDPDNISDLRVQNKSHTIIHGDFLAQDVAAMRCDAVAMNPPFTRNQDIKHVRHAYNCLNAGGCLAAIVSDHGFIGREREAADWRDWLAERGAYIEVIPAGAFKESGTGIQTRMIFIRKP